MKTEQLELKSIRGTLNLCLSIVYTAIKEGENIKSDALLSNMSYCLGLAGVSVELLTQLTQKEIKDVEEGFDKEALLRDCEIMSVNEVAEKYGKTRASIYSLCNRNKVQFKKTQRSDNTGLEDQIRSFNGELTLAQMAKVTHHSWSYLKDFCTENKLKYRTRG